MYNVLKVFTIQQFFFFFARTKQIQNISLRILHLCLAIVILHIRYSVSKMSDIVHWQSSHYRFPTLWIWLLFSFKKVKRKAKGGKRRFDLQKKINRNEQWNKVDSGKMDDQKSKRWKYKMRKMYYEQCHIKENDWNGYSRQTDPSAMKMWNVNVLRFLVWHFFFRFDNRFWMLNTEYGAWREWIILSSYSQFEEIQRKKHRRILYKWYFLLVLLLFCCKYKIGKFGQIVEWCSTTFEINKENCLLFDRRIFAEDEWTTTTTTKRRAREIVCWQAQMPLRW